MARVAPAAAKADDQHGRRRARQITYTASALILLAALVQVDAWPFSAYRLFSNVRTADGASLTLFTVDADGDRTAVRLPDGEVLGTTAHLYDDFARADPERAHAMADAWLDLSGVDPAEVATMVLERNSWTRDAATGERTTTSTTVLTEVAP